MKDIVEYLPEDAVAYLRLADGDTRFPIRPVPEGDFLIGSGPDCDLRLGDGQLPPLHSILRVSEESATCVLMVRSPELVVNGEPVRKAELQDGDLVEIGTFRFVFRFIGEQGRMPLDDLTLQGHRIPSPTTDAVNLTPAELVSEIEGEMKQVSLLNRTAQQGVAELMAELRKLHTADLRSGRGSDAASELLAGMNSEDILRQLQSQADRIEVLSDVLEHVVRQQQVMTQVLHSLTERLNEATSRPATRRASA